MLTQPELAQKIRNGYKKHNLAVTNERFYDKDSNSACPIFAAFSEGFDTVLEAYEANEGCFDLGEANPYTQGMAKALNADYKLIKSISKLFDKDKVTDLNEVLAKLDNNEYSAD